MHPGRLSLSTHPWWPTIALVEALLCLGLRGLLGMRRTPDGARKPHSESLTQIRTFFGSAVHGSAASELLTLGLMRVLSGRNALGLMPGLAF